MDKIIPFFTNSEGSSFMEGKKIVYGRQKEVRLKCRFRLQKLEMKRIKNNSTKKKVNFKLEKALSLET